MMLVLALVLYLGLGPVQAFDPFGDGPYPVEHRTFYPFLDSELDNMLDVWVPNTSELVSTPLVYLVGGLGGLIPGVAYNDVASRISSFGFTVVQPWILGNNPINNYEGLWMDGVMAWVESNLKNKLDEEGISGGVELDPRNLFVMGHSSGGHVAVEYLKHHCGDVKGQVLLSPVDGFDPFGLIELYAITPGEYLNYAIPTLVIMAGLDPAKGINGLGDLVPACAPPNLSNLRFYDAMPYNTWFINSTDYGHADLLDEFYANAVHWTHFCAVAPADKSLLAHRLLVSGTAVAFMKLTLGLEDCNIVQYLEDPSLMPVPVTVMQKKPEFSPSCDNAICVWQEEPFPQH